MQFENLTLGDGDDTHAGGHLLVEPGDVLLVAADPVQGLGDNGLKSPGTGVSQELLEAWTAGCGTADRVIGVDLAHRSNPLARRGRGRCAPDPRSTAPTEHRCCSARRSPRAGATR